MQEYIYSQDFQKIMIHHITTQTQMNMDFLEVEFMKLYYLDNLSFQS